VWKANESNDSLQNPGRADIDPTYRQDLDWLAELLGYPIGTGAAANQVSYLGRPTSNSNGLSLLVPTGPRLVSAAALERFDDGRSRRQRVVDQVAAAVGQAGLLGHLPGPRFTLPRYDLIQHLADVLNEPDIVGSITLGPHRRNRKPVIQLIAQSGRTVGYAKVGWSPTTTALVNNEARILRLVGPNTPNTLDIPTVIHSDVWRGLALVVTSSIQRSPLKQRRSQPAPCPPSIVKSIASLVSPNEQRVADLAMVSQWRETSETMASDTDFLPLLDRLVETHGDMVVPLGLWHGDLTAWNMASGTPTSIWDWEFAAEGRPVGFDTLHQHFETHRRCRGGTNQGAIDAVLAGANSWLSSLAMGYDPATTNTIADLYLAELLMREHQLGAHQEHGNYLAGLGPIVRGRLSNRLKPGPSL